MGNEFVIILHMDTCGEFEKWKYPNSSKSLNHYYGFGDPQNHKKPPNTWWAPSKVLVILVISPKKNKNTLEHSQTPWQITLGFLGKLSVIVTFIGQWKGPFDWNEPNLSLWDPFKRIASK